jgi:hypothetical protein
MLEMPGMSYSSIYLVVAIFVAVLHRVTVAVYNRYFHPLSTHTSDLAPIPFDPLYPDPFAWRLTNLYKEIDHTTES